MESPSWHRFWLADCDMLTATDAATQRRFYDREDDLDYATFHTTEGVVVYQIYDTVDRLPFGSVNDPYDDNRRCRISLTSEPRELEDVTPVISASWPIEEEEMEEEESEDEGEETENEGGEDEETGNEDGDLEMEVAAETESTEGTEQTEGEMESSEGEVQGLTTNDVVGEEAANE